MARLKILHIAPMNTSGVPGELVRAERVLGHDSRLVTLFRDRRGYFEDICLDLAFIDFAGTRWVKRRVSAPERLVVDNRLRLPGEIPPVWRPHTASERLLVRLRDRMWQPRIKAAIAAHGLDRFDVYQLDGGLDFTRQPHFIPEMHRRGRKIICCYTGSDLRTRGVIPEIDALSDLNVSVEFDHQALHPRLTHVFFPFDCSRFQLQPEPLENRPLRIGHAPTSWSAKGSDRIVPVLQALSQERDLEVALIQGLPWESAIALKGSCDIFIDQIGDLGYGINALEALAMGIAAASCLAPGFAAAWPDHPFVEVQADTLRAALLRLIEDREGRRRLGREGRAWVAAHHDSRAVVRRIHQLAGLL
ncbi:MAG TPA: hypothetical protein PKI62_16530 [bacterium]|nr:hypothetical protein [bacterium]HPR88172.1 hypothetical protein [bacterium]